MSNNFLDNKLIIEELSISEDLEELVECNDYYLEEDLNIFYSYPYYSANNYDYQYRLTLDNSLLLEEVKCDDNDNEFSVLKTVCNLDIKKGLAMIYDNIDIRDENENKLEVTNDIVDFELKESKNPQEILENNKSIVLLELYKSIQ
tara:strand:+ start:8447 stop:8884 length:438 start_codon:yes stop_codon:yes gene_type:complete